MKSKVSVLINLIFIALILLVIVFSRELLPLKSIFLREILIYIIWFLLIFVGVKFFYRDKVKDFGFVKKIKVPKKVKRNAIFIGLSLGIISNIIIFYLVDDVEDYLKGFNVIEGIILAILIGPIAEEIVFRGYIQTVFGFVFSRYKTQKIFWLPIIITSIIFGLLHFTAIKQVNVFQTLAIVFLALTIGLLSGYFKEKYNSLMPSINLHIATNMGAMFAVVISLIVSPSQVRKISERSNKPAYVFDMNNSTEFTNSLINFSIYEKTLSDSLKGKIQNISVATFITVDSSGKIINVQLDTLENKKHNIASLYFKEKALEVARKLPGFIPPRDLKKDTTIVFYVSF
ncbi:MAG: CPBP family glutamic-type intramembrane protease [Bacteroidales bacterium]|jgi:membrane protease YdiL (CAAX protease family)|nr:CPBP family glutamic-type intramembrane protease [Bacteroidales bacterium]